MNDNNNNNNNSAKFEIGGKVPRWNLKASSMASNTVNPIRRIVDTMVINPNPEKELIRLTIGRLLLLQFQSESRV